MSVSPRIKEDEERTWTTDNRPTIELGLKFPLHEPINASLLKAVAAEFVHMTAFLFIVIGTACFGCHTAGVGVGAVSGGQVVHPESCLLTDGRLLSIATAFGLTIGVLVYSSATFSGGHLNPAVTLGLLLGKKVTLMRAAFYWAAQMLGAILGCAFVYAIDRSGYNAAGGGVNAPLPGITDGGVWLMEALLTAVLVFVVFAATDSKRNAIGAHLPILAPFAIGFTVFIAHLVAIPIDGCSINPARSFGAAVVAGKWDDQWLFWVGPFTGSVIAAVLYEAGFRPTRKQILAPDDEYTVAKHDAIRLPEYAGLKGRREQSLPAPGEETMPAYAGLQGAKPGPPSGDQAV